MKMAHVTIMTEHLDESVAFYEEIVGLKIERDMRADPAHQIVFLANAAGEPCVELVRNDDAPYTGGGLLIGFEVEDAAAYREKLMGMGMEVGEMVSPNPHARFFCVKDPNGVEIQFVQEGI
ncbi:MAG: VOC family protein [Lachnospiraceae bacterium]|nr:VOC family protein [Lachnospiraceae bacterium]